jgi:phospholipid-binding lipoprotein MlaA
MMIWLAQAETGFRRMRRMLMTTVVATGLLGGCTGQGELEQGAVYDPIEPANRMVFAVNETLDTFVLQPSAFMYKETIPDPVRDMVFSFLNWLKSPVILANNVFQGDWKGAEVTASRFVANAPFFGFVDNATGLGVVHRDEDFGQTLAVYGASDGPYIVLPLLGPSNLRDTAGLVVDHFLDPINYIGNGDPFDGNDDRAAFQIGRRVVGAVDFRARNYEAINDLKRTSVDYYARVRTIYKQRRDGQITNGTPKNGTGSTGSTGEFEEYVPGGQPAERAGASAPKS